MANAVDSKSAGIYSLVGSSPTIGTSRGSEDQKIRESEKNKDYQICRDIIFKHLVSLTN